VITGFTLDILVILAGFMGMLWLLTGLFEGRAPIVPYAEAFAPDEDVHATAPDAQAPFIPMPSHLKSREEMVAWMTTELPRLTEEAASKSQGR
jgi:hypothetical protein